VVIPFEHKLHTSAVIPVIATIEVFATISELENIR
jgi:hypothetical protein